METQRLQSKKYHVINPLDGVVDRRLRCSRCRRDLPEAMFFVLKHVDTLIRKEVKRGLILNAVCRTCRQQQQGEWTSHPLYSPGLDRFWASMHQKVKNSARVRGLLVTIEKDDLLGLYLDQNGRCALTGLEMNWVAKGCSGAGNRAFAAPSVDRIDSKNGYHRGNVQIILAGVNMMKQDLPQDTFIELCRQVAVHQMVF